MFPTAMYLEKFEIGAIINVSISLDNLKIGKSTYLVCIDDGEKCLLDLKTCQVHYGNVVIHNYTLLESVLLEAD